MPKKYEQDTVSRTFSMYASESELAAWNEDVRTVRKACGPKHKVIYLQSQSYSKDDESGDVKITMTAIVVRT
jgi:hypothetical protein